MNKFLLIIYSLFFSLTLFSQVPQAINYQAIARDTHGKVLIEKDLSIKIAVLRGSATGTVIYEESHKATSGKTGVVNLKIGMGTALTGRFSSIDWSQSPYFVKFSMDVNGGTSYKEVATTQLLTVPYALYAETAGSVKGAVDSENYNFLIAPTSNSEGDLFAGTNPEYGDSKYFSLTFNVMYLNNKDQQVNYKIEGFPADVKFYDTGNGSGTYGRFFNIQCDNLPSDGKKYNATLVLSNKHGVSKRFPFVYQASEPVEITPPTVVPDEAYEQQLNALLDEYRKLEELSIKIDNAFMGKSATGSFEIFKNKTYLPTSQPIAEYWGVAYKVIAYSNLILDKLGEETNLSEIKAEVQSQSLAARAIAYLKLVEWFDNVPLILEAVTTPWVEYTQENREVILPFIITDLESFYLNTGTTREGFISTNKAKEKVVEAYLLNKQWQKVTQINLLSSPIADFYKKLAGWKSNLTTELTAPKLLNEYMTLYYEDSSQGNLILNILEYSAEYFRWNEDEHYKRLLPIPMDELIFNPNIKQNYGY